jgi:hypothetical protein
VSKNRNGQTGWAEAAIDYQMVRSDTLRMDNLRSSHHVQVVCVNCSTNLRSDDYAELAVAYASTPHVVAAAWTRGQIWMVAIHLVGEEFDFNECGPPRRRVYDTLGYHAPSDWDFSPGAIEVVARVLHHDVVDPQACIGIEHQLSKNPKTPWTEQPTGRTVLEDQRRTFARAVYLSGTSPVPRVRLDDVLDRIEPYTKVLYVD